MNNNQGWVKLHRQIQSNPLYFSEPFNRALAWVDLLLIANHSDNFFYKRGIRVDVKKGQIGYDLDTLAQRWKWSRGKVERFLKELEKDEQVVRQKTNVTTLISITNYDLYQSDGKADSKPNSKADGHQTVKQTETNKNDNNLKNEKNENKLFSEEVFFVYENSLKHFEEIFLPKTQSQKNNWLSEIDKLIRLDKLQAEVIITLIERTRNDPFWKTNFNSLIKLRQKNKEGVEYWKVFLSKFKNPTKNEQRNEFDALVESIRKQN